MKLNRIGRLIQVAKKPTRRIVGLMSGTSVDAIDAAIVEIDGCGGDATVRLIGFETYPFPPAIRSRLFRVFNPKLARIDEICNLDFLLGELFAEAANHLIRSLGFENDQIDLVGSVGQTIWHDPQPIREEAGVDWLPHPIETRSTLAIGQTAVIAERTGIITLGDIRVRDVAAGGHGAPLIAYADWVLLRHPTSGRCIQNIGGIGNVSYLPPGCSTNEVIAFDTGPGNMVIDALTDVETGGRLKFDHEGEIAARGTVDERILADWLEDPYFEKPPPKTTGREHFGVQFARRAMTENHGVPLENLIATATAMTAHSIARAYRDFIAPIGPIDEVIIGGGGALNPTLLLMIGRLLRGASILKHEDVGIDSKAKEAIAIAVIANDSIAGLNTNIPGATGGRPTVLGKISL